MNQGFFDQLGISVVKTAKRPSSRPSTPRSRTSQLTRRENETCEDCGLHKTCKSPRMPPTGEGLRNILLVAEAPGKTEDEQGLQLVGKSGQYLRTALADLGADLDRDFWKTNSVICRPPNNRTPSPKELRICRENLLNSIEVLQPNVVVLVGRSAFDSYMRPRLVGRIDDVPYSDWVGTVIPDQETGRWICPIYHPSYLIRQANDKQKDREEREDKVLALMFRNQLRAILDVADKPVPQIALGDFDITAEEQLAIEWIDELEKRCPTWVAFDYETTGIKPHRKGHRIYSISFCDGVKTRSFMATPDVCRRWGKFLEFCKSSGVGLIAHNMSFEEAWSVTRLGVDLRNIKRWDTMLGMRGINNTRACQLKFSVYTNLGVLGYDNDVDFYLKNRKEGEAVSCNAFNRIEEADKEKLLTYGGEDSCYTYKLFELQNAVFKKDKHVGKGMQFFFEAVGTLSRMQQNGVCLDGEGLTAAKGKINRRLECIAERIKDLPEVKKWDGDSEFNFNSSTQLSHLLFDILEVPVKSTTGSGKPSVDEEALSKIDLPIAKDVCQYRHWSKVSSTYLGQYEREVVDGLIHANFGLGNVDTFRSSSYDPNLQNVPKRDEQVKTIVRSLIRPRPGHRLIEYDYKALEVSIAGCVFKDPNWLSYCRDITKDMHRDTAIEILYLTDKYGMPWRGLDKRVAKVTRQASKNGFVFPSIYGSSGKSAAAGMWEQLPKEILSHLRSNVSIRNLTDFTQRMIEYDKEYWGERYPVYGEARKSLFRQYEKKGYIEQVTGFRCYGPLSFMQVVNYPVQGPASHVKLKALEDIEGKILDEGKDILPIMEIHDAMIFDAHPDDEPWLDEIVHYYGTKKIAEDWDWIIVPLLLEKERSEIDGMWSAMTSCGYLGGVA